ncbi:MAG: hypothetical protein WB930_16105 [Syntrophobacteraceae bacterium]
MGEIIDLIRRREKIRAAAQALRMAEVDNLRAERFQDPMQQEGPDSKEAIFREIELLGCLVYAELSAEWKMEYEKFLSSALWLLLMRLPAVRQVLDARSDSYCSEMAKFSCELMAKVEFQEYVEIMEEVAAYHWDLDAELIKIVVQSWT